MRTMHWLGLIALLSTTVVFSAEPTGRYKEIIDWMSRIQGMNPAFAKVHSIGVNDDDVEIYAMRISATPWQTDPEKAAHLIVGTHHGNEGDAATLSMRFIEDLIERYRSAELWRGDLADLEWEIIPVLNISGYNLNSRYEHGVDPNRDYPGPCISSQGGKLKSIRQLVTFMGSRIFSGSIAIHGYIGTLTYPWGVDVANDHTADHNYFVQITEKAAEQNGYYTGTSTEVVYPADGCYEDYAYWKYGMWSLLVELRTGSSSDISQTVDALRVYHDLLVATPSVQHDLTSQCLRRSNGPKRMFE